MSQSLTRRSILQTFVATAAASSFTACSDDGDGGGDGGGSPQVQDGAQYFPQSVASGDPRPDSVVLWARVADGEPSADLRVTLQVSTQDSFTSLVLDYGAVARASADGTVRVKVTGLQPATTYYYRFLYERTDARLASRTGRTRTAPAAGADAPVRFVVASCQDYLGRYYNAWKDLLARNEELDFIVFLGDYIYETTGDKSFQDSSATRKITFRNPEEALTVGTGDGAYQAAQSVGNYRDLYRNLRAEPVMQALHERYPFVITWDDHEFSDDSWGANATYTDGVISSERQEERRRNAEQAFFEYIPMDVAGFAGASGELDSGAVPRYPFTRIWRDFDFGKHLRLAVTDTRSQRPDHTIPEDAYPGTVLLTEAQLIQAVGQAAFDANFSSATFAYVNVDAEANAGLKQFLLGAYVAETTAAPYGLAQADATARAQARVRGNLSAAYIKGVLDASRARIGDATYNALLASLAAPAGRSIAYVHLGKRSQFGQLGSRYVAVKPTFDLWTAIRYSQSNGSTENVFGSEQDGWLKASLQSSASWQVVVSSVSLTSMVWDLRSLTLPPEYAALKERIYFNVDQWDGFPNKKQELLAHLATSGKIAKTLFVSGDIHAAFASEEPLFAADRTTVAARAVALTAPAISSQTIQGLAGPQVKGAGIPEKNPDGTDNALYAYLVTNMNTSLTQGTGGAIKYADTAAHGYLKVEITSETQVQATFRTLPQALVSQDLSQEAANAAVTEVKFRVQGGALTKL